MTPQRVLATKDPFGAAKRIIELEAENAALLAALKETVCVWEGEEDSVQREHATHIKSLKAAIRRAEETP